MKDKRGVTTQFCTIYRRTPADLLRINSLSSSRDSGGANTRNGGGALMKVGHFSYVSDPMGLGSLGGNRFEIVLRNAWLTGISSSDGETRIAATTAALEKATSSFTESGFINYFGMQRFGKYYTTHLTGIEVIKGDFEKAVSIIMGVQGDESDRFVEARKKWEARFDGVEISNDDATKKAEADAARTISRNLGRFMTCEQSILNSLSRNPRDYKRAFQFIPRNMRLMFVHSVQSYIWNRAASYRIKEGGCECVKVGDLVLTKDNMQHTVDCRTSALQAKAVKLLSEEDVAKGMYSIDDVVLPLVGTGIQYPGGSTGEHFETLLAEIGLTKGALGDIRDRELALKGDYRRLMCKPSDTDFEITLYDDSHHPLLQTDLMKVNGTPLPPPISAQSAEGDEGQGEEGQAGPHVGLIVCFTLPPSSYATIALRELMKRPTSSDYQRQLQLTGQCEAKLSDREEYRKEG